MVGLVVIAFAVVLSASPEIGQTAQPAAQAIVVPPEGQTQELLLTDGTRAIGRVEGVTDHRVTFRTVSGGTLEVEVSQIASLRAVTGRVVKEAFWPADSNPTRLFFAPTGRALKRGEVYFGVYEIVLPFVQVGLTDRISIGGGSPLFFGAGAETPFWITPKVQVFKGKTTEAAIGVLHFLNVGDGTFGIAYGVVTQGNRDSAVSVGVGYAYERYDESSGAPVVMVGGEHRVKRGLKLITENYFFDGGGLLSGGVRFLGERLSVDLGLVSPLGADSFIAFPMINFVWKF